MVASIAGNSAGRILVVGGGAAGLAAAWRLAGVGAPVTVLDAGRPGAAALWASGGMLAAGFESCFELDDSHPLAGGFSALLADGLARWPGWVADIEAASGQGLGFEPCGALTPALSPEEAAALEGAEQRAAQYGVPVRRLAAEALSRAEPALAPGFGGLEFPGDAQLDNRALGPALAAAIVARGGEVRAGVRVAALDRQAGRVTGVVLADGTRLSADLVVLATGAQALAGRPSAAAITPVKGQMIAFDLARAAAPRRVIRGMSIYLAAKPGGRLLAGASVEPGQSGLSTDPEIGARLVAAARAALPGLAALDPVEHWAGLRPRSTDAMPVVGEAEPGLALMLGGYRNGVLAAPALAEVLIQSLTGKRGALAQMFGPDREGVKR